MICRIQICRDDDIALRSGHPQTFAMARIARRAASLAVVGTCLVTGCGSSRSSVPVASPLVVRHFLGVPNAHSTPRCSVDLRGTAPPCAAWAGAGSIYVTTWGSGSCPNIPISVRVAGRALLVIRTHDLVAPGTPCTADLTATTSVLRLPTTIDATGSLAVQIDGIMRRLPPRVG